jgi:hypothetical protein
VAASEFHRCTVSSESPHRITHQWMGLLVTIPQTSHLNSCRRSHGFVPYINGWSTLLRGRGRSRTWRQHRQLADLLPLHRSTKVGGMTHHPKLGNHFADQLSMTEKSHHRTLRNHNAHRLGHSTHVGGSKCDGCRVPAARPLVRPGHRGSGTRKGQFRRGSPRTRHLAAPIP